jgi:hypothetical protein
MLELERRSTRELNQIGRQAEEECERRFRRIADASDPSDSALQDLLREMAAKAGLQVQAPEAEEHHRPFGSGRRTSPEGVREFLRASLRSLTKGFGEGRLHRDAALF